MADLARCLFGAQLLHPVLDSLKGTPNEYIRSLLFAFNKGDIDKFQSLIPELEKEVRTAPTPRTPALALTHSRPTALPPAKPQHAPTKDLRARADRGCL